MGQVAGELADLTYLTSDNPRSEDPKRILADIGAGVPANSESIAEVDREKAIALALAEAEEGDMVVIAGKGHETEQELADRVISFDDRDVARKALGDLRVGRGQRQCAK
jgi:UDP-N-acetylmuramoyl-L-alanyl-D-glutamate--2,6-diaminopimelate ligase